MRLARHAGQAHASSPAASNTIDAAANDVRDRVARVLAAAQRNGLLKIGFVGNEQFM